MKNPPPSISPALLGAMIGIVFFYSGYAFAAQDTLAGLLVRSQLTVDYEGKTTFYEELFYRDGLVVTRSTAGNMAFYGRGSLSAENLASLKRLLNDSRVGVIVADPGCLTASPLPTGASFSGALTWFGKNGRQNHLTFSSSGFPHCPADLTDLFLGVVALPVDSSDSITTVP